MSEIVKKPLRIRNRFKNRFISQDKYIQWFPAKDFRASVVCTLSKYELEKHNNKMNNSTISESFLLKNGFEKKESDEVYFESTLNSACPFVTIFVYNDAVTMMIGNEESQKLRIESEIQLENFIQTLDSVL